jgi:heat shock protein HslJ
MKTLRIFLLACLMLPAPLALAQESPLAGSEWGTGVAVDTRFVRFGSGGKVNGSGGCNSFMGSYTADGVNLKVGPLATTRKMCGEARMARETAWLDMLARTDSYRAGDNQLRLMDADNKEIITLKRRDFD